MGMRGSFILAQVVTSKDRSISALLGASPGASVCVNIVLEVARKSFGELFEKNQTKERLQEMIPTHGQNLAGMKVGEETIRKYREWSQSAKRRLGLIRRTTS